MYALTKVKCVQKQELFITCIPLRVLFFLSCLRIGDVQLSADTGGPGGLLKKVVTGALSHEPAIKPTYTGTGDVTN